MTALRLALAATTLLAGTALVRAETIPLIVKDTTSPYWQTVLAGGCQAAKDLKVDVPRLGPTSEADISGQVSTLENAVSQRPAAVVIAPTSFDGLGPAVDEAASKVKVIGIDSMADSKKFTSFLTTDNVEGGRIAGRALAEAIKAKYGKAEGDVANVSYIAGPASLRDRIAGFTEVLGKAFPGLKIATTRIGDGQTTTNLNQTVDILGAMPNLRGIFADAVFSGLGAGQAISEAKVQDRVMLISFDSSDQLVQWLQDGVLEGLIVQDPYRMGYDGVKTALAASKGEKVEAAIDTGANLVTKANMNDPKIAKLLKPDLSCK